MNSLDQSWAGEVNWIVPPPRYVIDCIRKLEFDKCVGTLILPEWVSAPFWPFIVDKSGRYRNFIKDVYMLPVVGAIKRGRGNNGHIRT